MRSGHTRTRSRAPRWLAAAAVVLGLAAAVAAVSPSGKSWLAGRVRERARALGLEITSAPELELVWPGALRLRQVTLRGRGVDLRAAAVSLAPAWGELRRGELRAAVVVVEDAALRVDAAALRAGRRAVSPPAAARGGARIDVVLERSRVRLTGLGALLDHEWDLDHARLEIAPRAGGVALRAAAALAGGGSVSATARVADRVEARLDGSWLSAEGLPAELRAALPVDARGTVDLALEVDAGAGLSAGRAWARASTADAVLAGPALAAEPVGPLALEVTMQVRWDVATRALLVEDAAIAVGPSAELEVRARGALRADEGGRLRLDARLAAREMAAVVAALPPVLRPPPGVPPVRGPLAGTLQVEGPWDRPREWLVEGKLDLAGMRAAAGRAGTPATVAAYRGPGGGERPFALGPEHPDYVPLAELPAWVPDAVTTSEDAGFYAHQGFDLEEIKASAVAVHAAGRAVRGGSTISQQLAKNLFLTREKTYARKVREALVTLALESALSKPQLLELYVNVIEWGPGIYGIGSAARAYFGKDARDLAPREAAYLASVIPNPRRYFAEYERGELSPLVASRLQAVLARMSERGQLAPALYVEAVRLPPGAGPSASY